MLVYTLFFNEMVFHNLALDLLHFIRFHTVMYLTGLLRKTDQGNLVKHGFPGTIDTYRRIAMKFLSSWVVQQNSKFEIGPLNQSDQRYF